MTSDGWAEYFTYSQPPRRATNCSLQQPRRDVHRRGEAGRRAGHGARLRRVSFDHDSCAGRTRSYQRPQLLDEDIANGVLGLSDNAATLKLYKNLGNGAFRDVTEQTGLAKVFMPMGHNFGDVDNDGRLDIYLGNGDPTFQSVVRPCPTAQRGGQVVRGHYGVIGNAASCTRGTEWLLRIWTTMAMKIL